LQSEALLQSVRSAFVHGMDVALLVSAGIALLGVLLTLVFLPGKAVRVHQGGGEENEGQRAVVT
ncbi:MAG: MFS transporter, partial [Candidatus Dormibacteraeota bacterium]|nr:MFS transporter [Candidatus Dormibacteraeota bacterium]